MEVKRSGVFIFELVVTPDEFNRIKVACNKWDESPEQVIEKIIEAGFDEGCQ